MNRALWTVAERIVDALRETYLDPAEIVGANVWEVTEMLRPLGFVSRRSGHLIALATAWLDRMPVTASDVAELPGCGRYASVSWAVFVEGRRDVSPTDGKLRWFLAREAGLV